MLILKIIYISTVLTQVTDMEDTLSESNILRSARRNVVPRVPQRAREVAQWIRAFIALAEGPGLVPSTHTVYDRPLQRQFQGIQCPLLA